MAEVASAVVALIPSFQGGRAAIARELDGPLQQAAPESGRRYGNRFGSAVGSVLGPMLAGITAGAAISFFSGAIEEASGLDESLNALSVTYGANADAVAELGTQAADALGLSNLEFNNLAVRFSNFANTIGGPGGDVAGVLDDLTGRASDFASVMNIDVADAAALFQSGLAGESEPLRQYGIDLSAATVQAYAYANGIAEQGAKLTEAQRIQATYGSLMAQTSATAGDFANTSDQLANQQRIMAARFADARAELGSAFLPILTDVTTFIADEVVPAFSSVASWVSENQWVLAALAGIIGTTLVAAFIAWTASIWAANAALLLNPLTWIILAVVALIAALVWLIANWDAVAEWLSTTWNNALTWAREALANFGNSIYEFFTGLPDRIINWLGDLGSLLWNAGKDLITGLINGVLSMVPGLQGQLGFITDLIPEWKGPPERDAKLLEGAGRLVLGGFIEGINSERGELRRTLNGVTDMVASQQYAMQGVSAPGSPGAAGGGGFTVINNGVDAQELAMKTERTFRDWQHNEAVAFR